MRTLKLAKNLFDRYESQHRIYRYYGLSALFALAQISHESKDNEYMEKCKTMLSLYPDKIEHPYYNFINYEVGGNGKAWLCFKGLFDEELENLRKYAEKTLASPADSDGILCMPSNLEAEKIWIDAAAVITPFMLYSGLALKEEKYIDFAAEQSLKIYDTLLDKTCGLLHQSRGFRENPSLISDDHWSRGNGWGYAALAELVKHLPKKSRHRAKVEKCFVDLSTALIGYQTSKGAWRQEITSDYSWDESSGTALIAYGLGVGLRTGLLSKEIFDKPFKNAINIIIKRFINYDFSTNMCCAACLCPGAGKEKGTIKAYLTEVYPCKDEPHSYGAFMLALLEAHRNGITDYN